MKCPGCKKFGLSMAMIWYHADDRFYCRECMRILRTESLVPSKPVPSQELVPWQTFADDFCTPEGCMVVPAEAATAVRSREPNAASLRAMAQHKAGNLTRHDDAEDLFRKLVISVERKPLFNEETMQTLRDADDGKNLNQYDDEDDLFRKLGVSEKSVPDVERCQQQHVLKEETLATLRDADAGKDLIRYPSLEAMFEDLGIEASNA